MSDIAYVIRPKSPLTLSALREIWQFRHLVWMFVWRDILVRYKNTVIGAAWYVTQPLAMTLTFTLFMAPAFRDHAGSIPYPLFAYSGVLMWGMFNRAVSLSTASLTSFESILGKTFFPRIIAPLSAVLGTLFDFLVAASILVLMMIFYGFRPGLGLLLLPLIVALTLMCAMGLGCILSALDARFRDVRHTVPLLLQIWMFCSPIIYPSSYVPEKWRMIFEMNPLVGLLDWFRWFLFSAGNPPSVMSLYFATGISILLFIFGAAFFQKFQGTVLDTL